MTTFRVPRNAPPLGFFCCFLMLVCFYGMWEEDDHCHFHHVGVRAGVDLGRQAKAMGIRALQCKAATPTPAFFPGQQSLEGQRRAQPTRKEWGPRFCIFGGQ